MEDLDYDYSNSTDAYYDLRPDEDYSVLVEEEPDSQVAQQLLVALYSLVCVLGLLGNGLVVVLAGCRLQRTVSTVWFLHLAAADLLFNAFLPLYAAYAALGFHWAFGTALCKLSNFLLTWNMHTSVLLLSAISGDRCVSVLLPVWVQNHRSPRRAHATCAAVWALAALLSAPALVFRDTTRLPGGQVACFNNFSLLSPGPASGSSWHVGVTVTRFLGGFLIPGLVIAGCYITIVCRLRHNRLSRNKKPFRIMVALVVTFFLCWCPYHTLLLMELRPHAWHPAVFSLGMPLATALAITNSCLNPILYVFMGQDFRKFKVTLFSRLANALSEDTGHGSLPSHRSFTRVSSVNDKSSVPEKETAML